TRNDHGPIVQSQRRIRAGATRPAPDLRGAPRAASTLRYGGPAPRRASPRSAPQEGRLSDADISTLALARARRDGLLRALGRLRARVRSPVVQALRPRVGLELARDGQRR